MIHNYETSEYLESLLHNIFHPIEPIPSLLEIQLDDKKSTYSDNVTTKCNKEVTLDA